MKTLGGGDREGCRVKTHQPAVHIWQEECGAQAMPFTHARWLFNLATGVQGTRTSSMITWQN